MSAASTAISVPAPIAIPTSAATSAGESLIPSPMVNDEAQCLSEISKGCVKPESKQQAVEESELEWVSDIEAWEYNPSDEDQRLPHKFSPNRPIPLEHVHGLGVLTWKLDVKDWENNPMLDKIKQERGYKYAETKIVSPDAMEDYEQKIKMFFEEHMHSQEEIRLILDGGGYWDIRNYDDKWIRFRVQKGDLIVLPPGMFHRFTLDMDNYIEALLLYTEVPLRTQHERSKDEEESIARRLYIENFLPASIEVSAQS